MTNKVFSLYKEFITNGKCSLVELVSIRKALAFAIDTAIINSEPTEEYKSLYDAVIWLQCNLSE